MNKKVSPWIIIGFVLLIFGFGAWYQMRGNKALKNFSVVEAEITAKGASRGSSIIFVKYDFNGRHIENSFDVIVDTFKVRQKLLLKVSNEYPDTYIDLAK